jgi:hypothetical protein
VGDGAAAHRRNRLRVALKPDPVWAFLEERDISRNELSRLSGISPDDRSHLMSGATVSVSADRSTPTVTAKARGTATVTVPAPQQE